MKNSFGQKGMALILVLAAIAVLTTAATEFSYNTNINYHLAMNERDRVQAYYLAKSAYRFMLLELKFDRVFRNMVTRYNLGQYLGANVQLPLCQQFPMSTELIRTVFLGGGIPGLTGGEGEEGGEEGEEAAPEVLPEGASKIISMSEREGATEFLDFTGDFDAGCIDEGTKFSLNGFYDLTTEAPAGEISALDKYKIIFLSLLERLNIWKD